MPAADVLLTAPELLQLGWVELVGHALHYGVIVLGLLGVVLLLAPGLAGSARRRPARRDPPATGEAP